MWNILISTNHTKRMLENMSQNCFSTQPGLNNNTPSIFYYSMSCSFRTGISFSVCLYGTWLNRTLDIFLMLVDTTNVQSNTIKMYFSLCCDHFPWRVFHTSRERQMADDFGHKKGIAFLQASENICRKKAGLFKQGLHSSHIRLFPHPQITYWTALSHFPHWLYSDMSQYHSYQQRTSWVLKSLLSFFVIPARGQVAQLLQKNNSFIFPSIERHSVDWTGAIWNFLKE